MPDAIIRVFPEPVIAGTIVRLSAEQSRDEAAKGFAWEITPPTPGTPVQIQGQGASMGYDRAEPWPVHRVRDHRV